MTELVEMLRRPIPYTCPPGMRVLNPLPINPDGPEAADTLEAQAKRIAELEGALGLWLEYDDQDEADFAQAGPLLLYARAINAARTALAGKG